MLAVDQNLWITVDITGGSRKPKSPRDSQNKETDEQRHKFTRLAQATNAWTKGALSNFDYLLVINDFAGRKCGDIYNHPVVPWIADFTDPEGGWRQLDRIKYRLAKGDDQLDESYRRQPAHHVPELLSDIGYMVYRARVESKQALCKHVRAKWVPEEYPSSLRRLYEWTPDECIPEYYSDAEIFKSIHADMADMELPGWTKNAVDFVRWHRERLESDYASANLHEWIDLAFGYKLSGPAAIAARNVHLSLVQEASVDRCHGTVQVFTTPHPRRALEKPDMGHLSLNQMFELTVNPLYALGDTSDTAQRPQKHADDNDNDKYVAPFELDKLLKRIYETKDNGDKRCEQSAMSVAVTLIEMLMANSCRDLADDADFSDRLNRARRLLDSGCAKISGNFQRALRFMLQIEDDPSGLKIDIGSDLHVHPLINSFSLPHHLAIVHSRIASLQSYRDQRKWAKNSGKYDRISELARKEIDEFAACLQFVDLEELWLKMFIDLLQDADTAFYCAYQLFNQMGQLLDPVRLKETLPALKHLYDADQPCPEEALKIYDRRFLLQLSIRFGMETFLSDFIAPVVEAAAGDRDAMLKATPTGDGGSKDEDLTISAIARESVIWLAQRIGPTMTAAFLSRNLLRMLALCYANSAKQSPEIEEMTVDAVVEGDVNAANVLECLIEIAALYGQAFICLHYFPFFCDLIEQAMRRLTPALEAAAVSAVVLLDSCANCLSDKQLMDSLQDPIIDSMLFPAVRLFSSSKIVFSTDNSRRLLACKTVRALHLLACRVGGENMKRYMTAPVQRLLCTFDSLYEVQDGGRPKMRENVPEQLAGTFTRDFARCLLEVFAGLCGRHYLLASLPNAALLFQLAGCPTNMTSPSTPVDFVITSVVSGNKLDTLLATTPTTPPLIGGSSSGDAFVASNFDHTSNAALNKKMSETSDRALTGNWLAHWRHQLGKHPNETPFTFNHMLLVSCVGHSGAVRRLAVLDNENSFVSASNDKTVKLWSIRASEQATTSCQWTYKAHTKPVVDLALMKSLGVIASLDSLIHIWDPFRGSTMRQYEWPTQSETSISCISALHGSTLIAASSSESVLRLLDIRCAQWTHHLCASINPTGNVRALHVSPCATRVAVALSNGNLSVLDIRVGRLIAVSSLLDNDVLALEWLSNDLLVSSHTDHGAAVWQAQRVRLQRRLPDTACQLAVAGTQLVTIQSNNKLRIYDRGEQCRVETKLRSDVFPGTVSSFALLPLNKLFLVASTNGTIQLLC